MIPRNVDELRHRLVGMRIGTPTRDIFSEGVYVDGTFNAYDFMRTFQRAARKQQYDIIELLITLSNKFQGLIAIDCVSLCCLLKYKQYDIIKSAHEHGLICTLMLPRRVMTFMLDDMPMDIVDIFIGYLKKRFDQLPPDDPDQLDYYTKFFCSITHKTNRKLINKIKSLFDNRYLSEKLAYIGFGRISYQQVELVFDDIDNRVHGDVKCDIEFLDESDDFDVKVFALSRLIGVDNYTKNMMDIRYKAVQMIITKYPDAIKPLLRKVISDTNNIYNINNTYVQAIILLMNNCDYTDIPFETWAMVNPHICDRICTDGNSHMLDINGAFLHYSVQSRFYDIKLDEQKRVTNEITAIVAKYGIIAPSYDDILKNQNDD